MRVLVTGVAGWVGSHAARAALKRGWDVCGLVRPHSDLQRLQDMLHAVRLIQSDLDDWPGLTAALQNVEIDACLHCAWFAEPGKYFGAPQNIASLMNSLTLMELIATRGCERFVGVGSCFEYSPRYGYFAEDTPVEATSLYAAAKSAVAAVLGPLGAALGVKTTWARLFLQYGPGEDARRLVPAVIRSLLAGEPVQTTRGEQVRDFLHIADVGAALVEVTAADVPGVVNIGSGEPVTVRHVIETLADQLGRPELVQLGALPYRAGDPMFICANNKRLTTQTQWRPAFTLDSGLADTVDWWRARGV